MRREAADPDAEEGRRGLQGRIPDAGGCARASNKVICLIPARDGQTYEMRRSELGEFIAPKHKITEFSEVRAGFRPALPRIPQELLRAIIGFFQEPDGSRHGV